MKSELQKAYKANGDKPVAFIDETYRTYDEHAGESAFYVLTAVVILPENFVAIQEDLFEIVEEPYWHTTQSLRTAQGRQKALNMAKYLGEGSEPCVYSVITSADPQTDVEELRKECFFKLFQVLNSEEFSGGGAVDLFVVERRRGKLVSLDQKTISEARKLNIVRRSARMIQVSPSDENLLWLPDLASSAKRQTISHGNDEYIQYFQKNIVEI